MENAETFEWTLAHRVATEALVLVVLCFGVSLFANQQILDFVLPVLSISLFVLAEACGAVQGQRPLVFRNLK